MEETFDWKTAMKLFAEGVDIDEKLSGQWCAIRNPDGVIFSRFVSYRRAPVAEEDQEDLINEKPARVQRKRTKGFKLPPNTVCVDRSTKWGNPYKIGDNVDGILNMSREHVVERYVADVISNHMFIAVVRAELKGKNLACYCPLNLPCHSDVLLKIANE